MENKLTSTNDANLGSVHYKLLMTFSSVNCRHHCDLSCMNPETKVHVTWECLNTQVFLTKVQNILLIRNLL